MASVIWTGVIAEQTYRVVDRGAGLSPRLMVEVRAGMDALDVVQWSSMDSIPRSTFEAMLLAAGVVT